MYTHPPLLPIGPVVRRLRVTVKWLRREVEAGHIPHFWADPCLLLDHEAVERMLLGQPRQKVLEVKNDE